MINHNSFYKSLVKKGGIITLSSNDQSSIGEVGNASGAWSQTGSVLGTSSRRERASGVGAGVGGVGGTRSRALEVKRTSCKIDLKLRTVCR